MTWLGTNPLAAPLQLRGALGYSAAAILTFNPAYTSRGLAFLYLVFLFCWLQLTRVGTARTAFYLGLGTGIIIVAPGRRARDEWQELPLSRAPRSTRIWLDQTSVDHGGAEELLKSFAAMSETVIVCKSI